VRGSKKKIGKGYRPVCRARSDRRSGDADFVLAGGARAEPSHPRSNKQRAAKRRHICGNDRYPEGRRRHTAAPAASRLERDRAERGAARLSVMHLMPDGSACPNRNSSTSPDGPAKKIVVSLITLFIAPGVNRAATFLAPDISRAPRSRSARIPRRPDPHWDAPAFVD
jgi:hypothetical protein